MLLEAGMGVKRHSGNIHYVKFASDPLRVSLEQNTTFKAN